MAPLVIDAVVMYQLLRDPLFYRSLPASLEHLRAEGEAAYRKALAGALGKPQDCAGCSSLKEAIVPVLNAYGRGLAAVQESSPELLNDLKRYIAKKRRGCPAAILLYYVDENGKHSRLTL